MVFGINMVEVSFSHCAARDLTLEAAQSTGASRSFGSRAAVRDVPFLQVKKLLDSRHDREILEGLRKVISVSRLKPPVDSSPDIGSLDDVPG